jgi:hypothetical protein
MNICECGRAVTGKKRHCNRCAIRRARQQWLGGECKCCGDSRRVVLVLRELATALDDVGRPLGLENVTLCGSCAVVLGRQKMTLMALQSEVQGYAA